MNLSWLKQSIRRIAPLPREVRPIRVTAPPCGSCMHWIPRVAGQGVESITDTRTGYRFCWFPQMHPDFSCFNKRIEPDDPSLFSDLDSIPDDPEAVSRFIGVGSGTLPYRGHW